MQTDAAFAPQEVRKDEEVPDGQERRFMPTFFQTLTLLAFHTFIQEKVDVAIIEVGVGGELDATNIVDHPVVCGITSLGIDHKRFLGSTQVSIAWHKGGIMKVRYHTNRQKPLCTVICGVASPERVRSRRQTRRRPGCWCCESVQRTRAWICRRHYL